MLRPSPGLVSLPDNKLKRAREVYHAAGLATCRWAVELHVIGWGYFYATLLLLKLLLATPTHRAGATEIETIDYRSHCDVVNTLN